MACLLNQTQHLAQVATPCVQNLVRIALGRKVDDTSRSVDLGAYNLIRDETTKRSFSFSCAQIQEFGQSRQGDLCVIASNNANVLYAESVSDRRVTDDRESGALTCSMTL